MRRGLLKKDKKRTHKTQKAEIFMYSLFWYNAPHYDSVEAGLKPGVLEGE